MPSWTRAIFFILIFGVGNHLNAQIKNQPQTGFAIVTQESGISGGLIPVETLFSRSFVGLQQTAMAPSPLLNRVAFSVNLSISADNSTGLAIANPSRFAANVHLSITDSRGIEILSQTLVVLPRGQLSRFLSELFGIPPGTTPIGLLTVTADVPVAVQALNFRASGFAATPVAGLFNALPLTATAGAFVFPQVVTGAGWSTEITISNTSPVPHTVRIDFFGPDGLAINSLVGIMIPPKGLVVFSTETGGIIPSPR